MQFFSFCNRELRAGVTPANGDVASGSRFTFVERDFFVPHVFNFNNIIIKQFEHLCSDCFFSGAKAVEIKKAENNQRPLLLS